MSVLDGLYAKARLNPQRVAFPEASNEKMMQAMIPGYSLSRTSTTRNTRPK